MTSRHFAVVFRFAFAAAAISAMAFQLFAIHIPSGYSVFNFFTYFTNLSNILISAIFIITAVRLLTARRTPTTGDTAVRGAVVVYIAFVGLVFNTLLRDADLSDLNPVVNVILHYLLPVAGVIDWLIWPPKNRLRFRVIWSWMIFPAGYAAFSIIRGALTGIYPYPFFNPDASGGYGGVAMLCGIMLVGFFVLALVVRAIGNWRGGFLGTRGTATIS